MSEIELRQLTKRFGSHAAVNNVSMKIPEGEFLVLLGPSGCGKSTILRLIAGLEEVSSGEIKIGDRIVNFVDPVKRNVAMVFQNYALYPHMSVFKNVSFPLETARLPKAEIEVAVRAAARILEIESLLDRLPAQLSGGQRQRVALARAIVRQPVAFLMDEPLSNLDAQLRQQTRLELMGLHRRLGITTLYVTHDQVEALTMGNRIAVMRDGVMQQLGSPSDLYKFPVNTFVASFMGSPPMNLITGILKKISNSWEFSTEQIHFGIDFNKSGFASSKLEGHDSRAVQLGVRPEDLFFVGSESENAIPGVVKFVELTGADQFISVEVGFQIVVVRTSPSEKMSVDQRVSIGANPCAIHVFGDDGMNLRN